MLDTNCDPDDADYPIASNDDANRSVKLVITLLADAIVDAKSGLLELAYLDETEDDVTMEDVIKMLNSRLLKMKDVVVSVMKNVVNVTSNVKTVVSTNLQKKKKNQLKNQLNKKIIGGKENDYCISS